MPTHPPDAGTTDTWTSIPWSHPRGWYLVSLSLVSPASGIQAFVPSNYSPVAGTQTHNHFSCWHHRHAGPPTHGSVACTHTHTCTCALKRVSYPGNLIGQDRLCRSGTKHGQTNAPTRKLFTSIQPFSSYPFILPYYSSPDHLNPFLYLVPPLAVSLSLHS